MSSDTCASHRLSDVKMKKCHNSVIYELFSTILKLLIKSHQLEAFCVDFVAYLENL